MNVSQTTSNVYVQVTIRNLAPTFGSSFGAQLLDLYIHDPAATTTSTAAAYPVAQLYDRPGGRLEPADRGAGLRPGHLGQRCGRFARDGSADHRSAQRNRDARAPAERVRECRPPAGC